MVRKIRHPMRVNRRAFMKASAATGAALAAGSVFAPAVHAAKRIKLGYVSPQTGPLAAFAEADNFVISNFLETVKDGVKVGSATYPVEVVGQGQPVQSQPRRRSRQGTDRRRQDRPDARRLDAGDDQSGVDAMRDRGGAVRLHAWRRGSPSSSAGRAIRAIRPRWKPFNYTYHFFWGLEDVIAVFTNMWGQLETNKSVGGLFPNDGDGNAWGDKTVGFPPVLDKLGYKLTDPGRYQNLTDDFIAQINAFKKANCEIITGVVLPPDFTTFWNQAQQQGFKPKVASIGKAHAVPGRRSKRSARPATISPPRSGGRPTIRSSRR